MNISVNKKASHIAEQMMADREALGVEVSIFPNGTKVIDASGGSLEAGKLFAKACMGGLGEVVLASLDFGSFWLPGMSVSVEKPAVACMASQYAGWAVKVGEFFAMGSGPARALYRGEELFARLSYKDESEEAVILLEARTSPDEAVAKHIAGKCGVAAENLYILIGNRTGNRASSLLLFCGLRQAVF